MENIYNNIDDIFSSKVIVNYSKIENLLVSLLEYLNVEEYVDNINFNLQKNNEWSLGYYSKEDKNISIKIGSCTNLYETVFDKNVNIIKLCMHVVFLIKHDDIIKNENTLLSDILKNDKILYQNFISKFDDINLLPSNRNASIETYRLLLSYLKDRKMDSLYTNLYYQYIYYVLRHYTFFLNYKNSPLIKSHKYFNRMDLYEKLNIKDNLSVEDRVYYGLPISYDEYVKVKRLNYDI